MFLAVETMAGLCPPASFGLECPILSCFNHMVRGQLALLPWTQFRPLGDFASLCHDLGLLTAVETRGGVSQGSQPTNRSGVAGAEQQAWGAETDPLLAPPDSAAWPICSCLATRLQRLPRPNADQSN